VRHLVVATDAMPRTGTIASGQYSAGYEVTGGMVTVTSVFGAKSAQLGRLPVEVLARMLLREQIADAGRHGRNL
jgi:hypothetical protein